MTIEATRIPHDGGENPVRKGETLARIWFRGGSKAGISVVGDGCDLHWLHNSLGADIIAYAVTPERAPSPPAKAPTMDAVEAVARALADARRRLADEPPMTDDEWARLNPWEAELLNIEAQAALSAYRPFIAAEWQPIETAPKNGSNVLLDLACLPENFVAPGYWDEDRRIWRIFPTGFWQNATAWQPLPAPPTAIKETIR